LAIPRKPFVLPAGAGTGEGNQSGITSRMQAVKSAWDKAPEGRNKASALKHYHRAEKAQKAGNDSEASRKPEESTRAPRPSRADRRC
jgi:hypothetical protein